MEKTPKGLRLHIGIFGRRNVGKSSLLNALTQASVSIVSETAGTTTDPVEKAMELLPIGPVLFIDTAGIDDLGALGDLRRAKTQKVFERTDLTLLVTQADTWGEYEEAIVQEFRRRETPLLVILNKIDLFSANGVKERLDQERIPYIETCARAPFGKVTPGVKEAIIKLLPIDWLNPPPIIADLIEAGDTVILVIPIDKEAPKGRLILPQVQTLREILDRKAIGLVVNEKELPRAMASLSKAPALVVTDSQVFAEVLASTPSDIPLTSFSILFARFKGDLRELAKGADAIGELKSGDRILIAEACTHHPIGDDIGRKKIPRWIGERIRGKIDFEVVTGHDFPPDLEKYILIIHCGACMLNRKEMLSRILEAKKKGVAITNYGMAIAYLQGSLKRALAPFEGKMNA